MIIVHKTTRKQYSVTQEAWAKMEHRGDSLRYEILKPQVPKEVKDTKAARVKQSPGIDNNEGNNDPGTSEDIGPDN